MSLYLPYGKPQYFDDDGNVLSSGKLYFYSEDTSTPLDVYPNSEESSQANNVTLDSSGRTENWIGASSTAKLVLTKSGGEQVWTQDNLVGIAQAIDYQSNSQNYGAATGSGNAYVVTLSPAITRYIAGFPVYFLANHTNTGAASINVNSVGAVPIKLGTRDVVSGEIIANQIYQVVYDGAYFQLASVDYRTRNLGVSGKAKQMTISTPATEADVQFDVFHDPLGFFSASDNTIFTVPAGVSKIIFGVHIYTASSLSYWFWLYHNSDKLYRLEQHDAFYAAAGGSYIRPRILFKTFLSVSSGDTISMTVTRFSTAGNTTLVTTADIHVIE